SQGGQIRGEGRDVLGLELELRHVRTGTLRFGVTDPALEVVAGPPRAHVRQVRADRCSELPHGVATVTSLNRELALAFGHQRARLERVYTPLLSGDDGRGGQEQNDDAHPLHDARSPSALPSASGDSDDYDERQNDEPLNSDLLDHLQG